MIVDEIKKIKILIKENPEIVPQILDIIKETLEDFRSDCLKKNNSELREALGDAVSIIALDRKPKDLKNHLIRIKNAIFKNGINDFHHDGEKRFYNKYIKEK